MQASQSFRRSPRSTKRFGDSHFNINVKGAFFLIKHAIPVIPDGGAIILTGLGGRRGTALSGGSTVHMVWTKAALRSFGRTIAKERCRAASGSTP